MVLNLFQLQDSSQDDERDRRSPSLTLSEMKEDFIAVEKKTDCSSDIKNATS